MKQKTQNKQDLEERLSDLVLNLSSEKGRRAMKLFAKVSRLTNEELRDYVKNSKGAETLVYGLAQSVLATRGAYFVRSDKTPVFRGNYAGAYVNFKDLPRASFYGKYAGLGTKFEGKFAGAFVEFDGDFAGSEARFEGNFAGVNAKFEGYGAGLCALFEGNSAGSEARFKGNGAGRKVRFKGYSSGQNVWFEGDFAGCRASFEGNNAGRDVRFKGHYSGEYTTINGKPIDKKGGLK